MDFLQNLINLIMFSVFFFPSNLSQLSNLGASLIVFNQSLDFTERSVYYDK